MPCRCTADNLRLFVQSIAQVELSTPTRIASSQQFAIRSFRHATTSPVRSLPRIAYSTVISSGDRDGRIEAVSAFVSERRSGKDGVGHSTGFDTSSAFVDFSPGAVDAIAAEVSPHKSVQEYEASSETYETPLKSLLKDLPMKKPKPLTAPASKTTFWSRQVANESLGLHFTSPRRTALDFKSGNLSASNSTRRDERTPPAREHWQIDKESRARKFPDGWRPQKRLSPDAIAGIRALHAQMPEQYTTLALSQEFGVTAEAIRRILKSKWSPSSEEETDRARRWFKRGQKVWSRWADLGVKPPKPWRELGIGHGKPDWRKRRQEGAEREQEPAPMPALITTARRREAKSASEAARSSSLADRIL